MRLIGCVCKYSDVFSLAVLIGRGLDLNKLVMCSGKLFKFQILFLYLVFRVYSLKNELCTISSVGRAPDS